jgi:multiple sugar transport system ATP-binding protein
MSLAAGKSENALECALEVNEMMGSELHLHVTTENGKRIIVRVPTISMDEKFRHSLHHGTPIYVTFEGKAMHFFDPETTNNILL